MMMKPAEATVPLVQLATDKKSVTTGKFLFILTSGR